MGWGSKLKRSVRKVRKRVTKSVKKTVRKPTRLFSSSKFKTAFKFNPATFGFATLAQKRSRKRLTKTVKRSVRKVKKQTKRSSKQVVKQTERAGKQVVKAHTNLIKGFGKTIGSAFGSLLNGLGFTGKAGKIVVLVIVSLVVLMVLRMFFGSRK